MQMSRSNINAQFTAARVPQYSDGGLMPRGDTDSVPTVAPILCTGITIRIGHPWQTICDTDFVFSRDQDTQPGIHDQPYGVRLFVLNNPCQCNPIEVHSMVDKHVSGVCFMTYICSLALTLYHFIWSLVKLRFFRLQTRFQNYI